MDENLEIIRAQYDSSDKKSITFTLLNKANNEEIPFGYIIDSDDQAPITLWLNELWKTGEIKPEPYIEPVVTEEAKATLIRSSRNTLLDNTDKYMAIDYPITEECRAAFREYRQALRDIPEQEGFPDNVIWPVMPEIVKAKKST